MLAKGEFAPMFRFLIIFCMASFLSVGCARQYPALSSYDPLYIEHSRKNVIPDSESYDAYVQRAGELVHVGEYGPKEGESYSDFEKRLYNTLEIQDYQIAHLKEKIRNFSKVMASLEGQLSEVKKAHADLKKEVGLQENWEAYDVKSKKKKSPRAHYFAKYTVKKGDTLQEIAKSRYGTNRAWLTLYRFNMKALKSGPNDIEIGDQLVIPPVLPPLSEKSSDLLVETTD